jgi:hypothetical protein
MAAFQRGLGNADGYAVKKFTRQKRMRHNMAAARLQIQISSHTQTGNSCKYSNFHI